VLDRLDLAGWLVDGSWVDGSVGGFVRGGGVGRAGRVSRVGGDNLAAGDLGGGAGDRADAGFSDGNGIAAAEGVGAGGADGLGDGRGGGRGNHHLGLLKSEVGLGACSADSMLQRSVGTSWNNSFFLGVICITTDAKIQGGAQHGCRDI